MSEQPKTRDSVTVTPKRAGEGASAYDVQLDLTIIEPLFHMRQKDAAKFLGISLTTLKRACRLLGVQRWPYARLRDERAGNQALLLDLEEEGDEEEGGEEEEEEEEEEECYSEHEAGRASSVATASSGHARRPLHERAIAPASARRGPASVWTASQGSGGAETSSAGVTSSSSRTTPRIDGEGTSSPQSRGETPGSHTESAPEPSSQAIDAHWLEWYLSCEDEDGRE
ncbi:hypothetical protein GUITHDRAFT_122940 [Guillardia theta CCMP2712]|uniref:RWP-RK domain-containing protein n=1 Tax=Guillardia theta (strain CCMP2712) TaxID=905079 RepID=L1I3R2_GUITC|nr:hypothetical protein GUITHDRAFT_122940 [Guillardia theta CCMP2712]EKX30851.1 hypothetical protein GUITHDRAFT_122940 [Guillardia theta CCMP2712]|eukprot:XP_005817831.1 hypothetical protein GUITHDRAFT_122940 [Guillardia theta CCMP2712]